MMMKKLIKDILTGADNYSFDSGRFLCFLSFFVYYSLAFGSYLTQHPWTAIDFSTGVCSMAVGFGIHLRLKSKTEPRKR